jgi:uncharacterized membrane protein
MVTGNGGRPDLGGRARRTERRTAGGQDQDTPAVSDEVRRGRAAAASLRSLGAGSQSTARSGGTPVPRRVPEARLLCSDSMPDKHSVSAARSDASARTKLLVSVVVGLVVGGGSTFLGAGKAAPLIGWDALAVTFCVWMWSSIWRLDVASTQAHSQRENPGRQTTDLVVVAAGLASIVAVGVVLFGATNADGSLKFFEAGLALFSVFVTWTTVHTVYTTRYAQLYYEGTPGGIDFNEDEQPDYRDFAYLAFTVGMTFQVSDTDLKTKSIRRTALHQALVSFPLGTVIIAASINLVSGLAK